MAKINGEEVHIIESDKENKIVYVEFINGDKKWINEYELVNGLKDESDKVIEKPKKPKK